MWNENTHWTKCFLNTHWNAPEWRVQLLHTAYKVDYLKESFQDDKLNKFNFDIFTGVKRTASLKSLRLRDLLTVLTFGYLTFPYLPYGSWVFNLTVPYLALLGGSITFLPLNRTISPIITTNHPLIFYNNSSFTR